MIEKIYPAVDEALPEVLAFIEEELEKLGCSMKTILQITVCVEEMFVNVAHYAYGNEKGNVWMAIGEKNGMAVISITDEGMEFDPLAKMDPDITLSAEERQIGGLGIFMVKKSMNEVSYERADGKNIFVMKKEII